MGSVLSEMPSLVVLKATMSLKFVAHYHNDRTLQQASQLERHKIGGERARLTSMSDFVIGVRSRKRVKRKLNTKKKARRILRVYSRGRGFSPLILRVLEDTFSTYPTPADK